MREGCHKYPAPVSKNSRGDDMRGEKMRFSWFLNGIPALVLLLLSLLIILGMVWLIIKLLPYLIIALVILIVILGLVYFIVKVFS